MKKTIAILFAALLPLAALAQTTNQFYGRLHVWPNWTHSISSTVTHAVATETINNATFVDSATNAPTYASYRLYIGGVAGPNSTWKKVR